MNNDLLPDGMTITPVRAFTDNYIWCLHNAAHAIVVDPGDAEPVLSFCREHGLKLAAILITHHHGDHTGGIRKLVSAFPDIPVIGPRGNHIRGITKSVAQGDTLSLPIFKMSFSVLEVPGHTLDHIAFFGHGVLFCGDTLFSAGCGRLFEGSPEQMVHSLNKLMRLPDDTLVYCTHEYTQANLRFALTVDSDNADLKRYAQWVAEQRDQDAPSLPSTVQKEKAINPFLRYNTEGVAEAVRQHSSDSLHDDIAVFAALRRWKDEF
ncbi:hydroxyacylglutathione hydrolase [Alteromonas sp. CYL-A6]|uniref:hydroxyacylglutathione hydrolase n=1 Tax=Alteromonas nitratireducens TaxID=3390813 RepID=UPI0034A7BD21